MSGAGAMANTVLGPGMPVDASAFITSWDGVFPFIQGVDVIARFTGMDQLAWWTESHPKHFALVYLILIVVTTIAAYAVKFLLNLVWPSFGRITPKHKQMYVVMNIFKATILMTHCLSPTWWVMSWENYRCNLNPFLNVVGMETQPDCDWTKMPHQQYTILLVGGLYVTSDVVALIVVDKLPFGTKLHHYMTGLFCACVTFIPSAMEYGVAQKLFHYGFWSTLAFPVNYFLAFRIVEQARPAWMMALSLLSLITYIVVCVGNWGIHAAWLVDVLLHEEMGAKIGATLYCISLATLINDDLILMKWLYNFYFNPKPPRVDTKKNN